MTISSKTVQPRHWTTLIAVGRNDPRAPSGARIRVMPGTPAFAPIMPAVPTIALPMTQPTTIATNACGSESAGTRIAPATITRSDTPRFPHRRPRSNALSVRSLSGTGSIPQLVDSSLMVGGG